MIVPVIRGTYFGEKAHRGVQIKIIFGALHCETAL